MLNFRTDLAVEAKDMYVRENKREIEGVTIEEETVGEIKTTKVKIETEEAGEKLGKPIGNYITIDFPQLIFYEGETMDEVAKILDKCLSELIDLKDEKLILVVGLGNWRITADSLGPKVAEKIMVTRHIKELMPEVLDEAVRPVSCISPGVLGVTGIETGEVIKSVVDTIKPDLVICIDALGSRKLERVNRTIQISDSGISPGAGVGNHRMKLNEESLGVKVIGIGVPTVVHAATIANDVIDLIIEDLVSKVEKGKDFYKMLNSIDRSEKELIINSALNNDVGELMVTPKDVDSTIESLSKIIANGINMAIQPHLDMEEINKFMG